MEFYTKYKRPEKVGEKNDGISSVERAGYIPAKQKVENLMMAGVNLYDYRRENYDIGHGETIDENIAIDPTRKGLDMAEASMIAEEVAQRIKEAAKEANKPIEPEQSVEVPEVQKPLETKEVS